MFLTLLMAMPIQAEPYVLSLGDAVSLGQSGTFGRAGPADDGGWDYFYAAGGGYLYLPLDADLAPDHSGRMELTGHSDLIDHAIVPCDDGGWLHAAHTESAGVSEVFLWRYDDAINEVASTELMSATPERRANDMAVICAGGFQGATVTGLNEEAGPSYFLGVDADFQLEPEILLPGPTRMTGGSLYYEPADERIYGVGQEAGHGQDILITPLDRDWNKIHDHWQFSIFGPDARLTWRTYWHQATLRVGNAYVVAHMGRKEDDGWPDDVGDVYLAIFDLGWNQVEHFQVTALEHDAGAMRPGLARSGETFLVTWDAVTDLQAVTLTLDVAALEALAIPDSPVDSGLDTADTDSGGTDTPVDSGSTAGPSRDSGQAGTAPPPEPAQDCGCSTARRTGSWAWAALLVSGLIRRRQWVDPPDPRQR